MTPACHRTRSALHNVSLCAKTRLARVILFPFAQSYVHDRQIRRRDIFTIWTSQNVLGVYSTFKCQPGAQPGLPSSSYPFVPGLHHVHTS